MSNQQFKPKFTIFDERKLTLYGARWQADKREAPSCRLRMYGNNPRFSLYLNNGGYSKGITIALNPYILYQITDAVLEFSKLPMDAEATRRTWEIKSYRNHKGEQYDKPTVVAKIYVGVDKGGVLFLGLHASGEDVARFPFTSDFYASLVGGDGNPLTEAEASRIVGRSWAMLSERLVANFMVENPVDVEGQKQNNQGGGNRRSQGGGNYGGNKSNDFDDDISF